MGFDVQGGLCESVGALETVAPTGLVLLVVSTDEGRRPLR